MNIYGRLLCAIWLISVFATWFQFHDPAQYFLLFATIGTIVYTTMVYCFRNAIHQVPRLNDCHICLEPCIGPDFAWCFFCKNRFHMQCCHELNSHTNKCPVCRKPLVMIPNNIPFLCLRIHLLFFIMFFALLFFHQI